MGYLSDFTEYDYGSGTPENYYDLSSSYAHGGSKSLRFYGSGAGTAVLTKLLVNEGATYQDLQMRVYVYIPTTGDYFANLIQRFVDADNFLCLSIDKSGERLSLVKIEGGSASSVYYKSYTISTGTWLQIDWYMKSSGGKIYTTVAVNGTSEIDTSFDEPSGLTSGYFGLAGGITYSGGARSLPTNGVFLDDLTVYEL